MLADHCMVLTTHPDVLPLQVEPPPEPDHGTLLAVLHNEFEPRRKLSYAQTEGGGAAGRRAIMLLRRGGTVVTVDEVLVRIPMDKAAIAGLCHKYGIKELSVSGSVLRGDFDPARSDIDIFAGFAPGSPIKSLCDIIGVKHAFSDLLGREVDLVEKRALSPYIKDQVLEARRVIYVAP